MGFDQIFLIDQEAQYDCDQFGELPPKIVSEAVLREQVLEAHKTLMGLNENNLIAFQDLVAALEQEQDQARGTQPRKALAAG